ncbi:MAG: hypothetical protein KQ78_02235 [Candidatus Izimaplasma bacterium HR2]|nr:MAG: hypothetical protein KQ78_02235 [Candidatus Izimaplasma bacterium HR2]
MDYKNMFINLQKQQEDQKVIMDYKENQNIVIYRIENGFHSTTYETSFECSPEKWTEIIEMAKRPPKSHYFPNELFEL